MAGGDPSEIACAKVKRPHGAAALRLG